MDDALLTSHRCQLPKQATVLIVAGLLLAGLLSIASPAGAVIRINDGDDCPDVIAPVANLYTAFFLREPDAQGLDYWVQFVSSSDGSLSAAAKAFAGSPEFVDRYGDLTTEEFVAQLYPNVFGRAADDGGLAFWTNDIDSGARTRSEVIVVWSLSPEFLGEDNISSPLAFDLQRQEVWCGSGSREVMVPRLPLTVGQDISVRPVGDQITPNLQAQITGLSENGTHVVSTGGAVSSVNDTAPNLYVHPNVGQVVDRYRVRVNVDDPVDDGGPSTWIIVSTWWPPPWRMY